MSVRWDIRDALTPALRRKLGQVRDKGPLLRAAAGAVISLSEQAFDDAALRPAPWAPKRDGSPATLKGRDGVLARSLTANPPQSDRIEIGSFNMGSDRQYARAQNFGYAPRGLPARPFLQILADGSATAEAEAAVREALERRLGGE